MKQNVEWLITNTNKVSLAEMMMCVECVVRLDVIMLKMTIKES